VNFVKSPYDDDFQAAQCPSAAPACRKRSYLVTGDLVFTGRSAGGFTCVSFQSPTATTMRWTSGWLPTAALTPVARRTGTRDADWLGTWRHPGGPITITRAPDGRLHVEGGISVPTARNFHTGDFAADVTPRDDRLDVVDQGDAGCRVRLERFGPSLAVADNGGCGGAGVSFLGLYRRDAR
jgi:hypothetical protein